MLDDIILAIIGEVAGDAGAAAIWKKRARVARGEERALVAWKVRAGTVAGVTNRWREVEVEPSSGALRYELHVLRVSDVSRRQEPLRLRDLRGVPLPTSDLVAFELRTTQATVDLVAWDQDADWLEAQLSPAT